MACKSDSAASPPACKTGRVCQALTKISREICVDKHNAITGSRIDPATLRRGDIVGDLRVISLYIRRHRRTSRVFVHLQGGHILWVDRILMLNVATEHHSLSASLLQATAQWEAVLSMTCFLEEGFRRQSFRARDRPEYQHLQLLDCQKTIVFHIRMAP